MYAYGYRYNSGLVIAAGGGAPFANTSSLSFDGADDYVDCGVISTLQSASQYSLSCWVKTSDITRSQGILKWYASSTSWIELSFISGGLYAIPFSLGGYGSKALSGEISNDVWYNVIMVFDGALTGNLNRLKVYINGIEIVLVYTGTIGANTTAMSSSTFKIGERYTGLEYFLGNIDEVSIYDYALSPAEALAIGGTIPTDLSLLATPPTHWYRNGDDGSWKSPQWLIPNNENFAANKVSNYSTQFDGVDDSVQTSYIYPSTGDLSVSYWVKTISNSDPQYALSIGAGSLNSGIGKIGWHGAQAHYSIQFQAWDVTHTLFQTWTATTPILIGQWYHILYVYDDSTTPGRLSVYIDGQLQTMKDWGNTVSVTEVEYGINNLPLIIGALTLSNPSAPSNFLNGNVDEVSIFESNESSNALTIYNGGTPTTIIGASSYWKMGENSTFLTNWTVPDEVGANDGTSANMTIEDRVGEAPSSENNAVSLNMDFVDVVPDTP